MKTENPRLARIDFLLDNHAQLGLELSSRPLLYEAILDAVDWDDPRTANLTKPEPMSGNKWKRQVRQESAKRTLQEAFSANRRIHACYVAAICKLFANLPTHVWEMKSEPEFQKAAKEHFLWKGVLLDLGFRSLLDLRPAGRKVVIEISQPIALGPNTENWQAPKLPSIFVGDRYQVIVRAEMDGPVRAALFDIDFNNDKALMAPSIMAQENHANPRLIKVPNKAEHTEFRMFPPDGGSSGVAHMIAVVVRQDIDVPFPTQRPTETSLRKLQTTELEALSGALRQLRSTSDFGVGILRYEVLYRRPKNPLS